MAYRTKECTHNHCMHLVDTPHDMMKYIDLQFNKKVSALGGNNVNERQRARITPSVSGCGSVLCLSMSVAEQGPVHKQSQAK